MHTDDLPLHILQSIENGNGYSYKHAIKFEATDLEQFVGFEYQIIDEIFFNLNAPYKIHEQLLVITKKYFVYDVFTIHLDGVDSHSRVFKLYFDITSVFGCKN